MSSETRTHTLTYKSTHAHTVCHGQASHGQHCLQPAEPYGHAAVLAVLPTTPAAHHKNHRAHQLRQAGCRPERNCCSHELQRVRRCGVYVGTCVCVCNLCLSLYFLCLCNCSSHELQRVRCCGVYVGTCVCAICACLYIFCAYATVAVMSYSGSGVVGYMWARVCAICACLYIFCAYV